MSGRAPLLPTRVTAFGFEAEVDKPRIAPGAVRFRARTQKMMGPRSARGRRVCAVHFAAREGSRRSTKRPHPRPALNG